MYTRGVAKWGAALSLLQAVRQRNLRIVIDPWMGLYFDRFRNRHETDLDRERPLRGVMVPFIYAMHANSVDRKPWFTPGDLQPTLQDGTEAGEPVAQPLRSLGGAKLVDLRSKRVWAGGETRSMDGILGWQNSARQAGADAGHSQRGGSWELPGQYRRR